MLDSWRTWKLEIAWGQNLTGCATCRSEYDLLAQGREEEHGTIKWDLSVAKLGEDAEWSEQRAFVNLPDSWRALKITIDLKKKKKNCPGNASKLEPGTVLPSPGSENQTLRQALGSLSLPGDSSPQCEVLSQGFARAGPVAGTLSPRFLTCPASSLSSQCQGGLPRVSFCKEALIT